MNACGELLNDTFHLLFFWLMWWWLARQREPDLEICGEHEEGGGGEDGKHWRGACIGGLWAGGNQRRMRLVLASSSAAVSGFKAAVLGLMPDLGGGRSALSASARNAATRFSCSRSA